MKHNLRRNTFWHVLTLISKIEIFYFSFDLVENVRREMSNIVALESYSCRFFEGGEKFGSHVFEAVPIEATNFDVRHQLKISPVYSQATVGSDS